MVLMLSATWRSGHWRAFRVKTTAIPEHEETRCETAPWPEFTERMGAFRSNHAREGDYKDLMPKNRDGCGLRRAKGIWDRPPWRRRGDRQAD